MVQDDLSNFFDTLQIKIGSFGKWKQTDVNNISSYTIGDCESYVRPQYSKDTPDIINGAIGMVTCNMSSPVKIKDIAAGLNISERKLYKHFEDMFGMSPGRYFTNFKIKKAEDMLLGTDMTPEQISEAPGFCSVFERLCGYAEHSRYVHDLCVIFLSAVSQR